MEHQATRKAPVCPPIVFVTDEGSPRVLRWRLSISALEICHEKPIFDAPPSVGSLDKNADRGDGDIDVKDVRSGAIFGIKIGGDGKAGAVTRLTPPRPLVSLDGMPSVGGMRLMVAEQEGCITLFEVVGDHADVRTLREGLANISFQC